MYFTEINDFVQQKMLYISQLEIKRSVQYEVVLVPVIQKKKCSSSSLILLDQIENARVKINIKTTFLLGFVKEKLKKKE